MVKKVERRFPFYKTSVHHVLLLQTVLPISFGFSMSYV